jgi:hypothetical protein
MISQVFPPFPLYSDINGEPLENGYIYVGDIDSNPEVNPIPVFWDSELTIPAAQPIRTLSGYPVRDGSPAKIFVDGEYSMIVKNKNNTLVYSSLSNPTYSDYAGDAETLNGESGSFYRDASNLNSGTVPKERLTLTQHDVFLLEDYNSPQDAIDAMGINDELWILSNNVSFDGITIDKKIHIKGLGREQGVITGTITLTNNSLGVCFEEILFNSPSEAYLFDVIGRGGVDFKRCGFSPGTGKFIFQWDDNGTNPIAIELMQCITNNGKLLDCSGAGVKTFSIHVKEVSLVNFNENNQLTTSASNYGELLVYDSLVNVDSSVTIFATTQRGLVTLHQSILDDQTTGKVLLTNGTGVYDSFDITDCTINRTSSGTRRLLFLESSYGGYGISSNSPIRAGLTSGSLAINGDGFRDYYVITGDNSLSGNVIYSISGGTYEGQRIRVYFTGTQTCNGYTLNLFGINYSTSTQSVGPCAVELIYINSAWSIYSYGRSRFSAQTGGTQPNVSNTSGATLGELETSVNAVKEVLRQAEIMN